MRQVDLFISSFLTTFILPTHPLLAHLTARPPQPRFRPSQEQASSPGELSAGVLRPNLDEDGLLTVQGSDQCQGAAR